MSGSFLSQKEDWRARLRKLENQGDQAARIQSIQPQTPSSWDDTTGIAATEPLTSDITGTTGRPLCHATGPVTSLVTVAPGLDKFRSNPCLCSKKAKTTVLLWFPERNVELSLPLILKFPQKGNVLSFGVAKAEQMPLSSTPFSLQYSSIPFFKLIVPKNRMQLIFHRINTHTHTHPLQGRTPKISSYNASGSSMGLWNDVHSSSSFVTVLNGYSGTYALNFRVIYHHTLEIQ